MKESPCPAQRLMRVRTLSRMRWYSACCAAPSSRDSGMPRCVMPAASTLKLMPVTGSTPSMGAAEPRPGPAT